MEGSASNHDGGASSGPDQPQQQEAPFKVTSFLKQAREWAYPQRTTSAFLTKGVLTPEEFVLAGDELVFKCPTWSWERGDPKKVRSYLPPDKQFLMTRNVPCPTRATALEGCVDTNNLSNIIEDGNDDEDADWLVSNLVSGEERARRIKQSMEDEFDILDGEGEVVAPSELANAATSETQAQEEEEEDEYADMAGFEDDNVMMDEAAAAADAPSDDAHLSASKAHNTHDNPDYDNLMKVRTYDLSITYDKYYQTPRVWMMGYAADNDLQPLTGDQMLEDVMGDYANKTVTIEAHPHVSGPHASIHPCQHGKVMKTIVRNLTKEIHQSIDEGQIPDGSPPPNKGPSVEMYLFIFLKFVNSIIPTINYDFTMDVTASTKK